MFSTLVRLAESATKHPLNLNHASAALLPPIPCVLLATCGKFAHLCRLYRRLLRAHRNLPSDMRSLGDDYIKSGMRFGAHFGAFLNSKRIPEA